MIGKQVVEELPFIATTENVLTAMVQEGANHQDCHEEIRKLSMVNEMQSKWARCRSHAVIGNETFLQYPVMPTLECNIHLH